MLAEVVASLMYTRLGAVSGGSWYSRVRRAIDHVNVDGFRGRRHRDVLLCECCSSYRRTTARGNSLT